MPVNLICPVDGVKFSRTPSEAARSKHNFCSHRCSASDLEVQGQIAAGRTGVRALKLPRDGTVERLYSEGSSQAEIARMFGANDESVRAHLQRRGFLPKSQNAKTRATLSNQEVVELYRSGLNTHEIAARLGTSKTTIAARLRAEGIEFRKSFFGPQTPVRCVDGHLVRSSYEQRVCNWLWEHDLAHAYEPLLPFAVGHLAVRQFADFFCRGQFIEIWGIQHSPAYEVRKQEKLARYAEAGLNVVSLLPDRIEAMLREWVES